MSHLMLLTMASIPLLLGHHGGRLSSFKSVSQSNNGEGSEKLWAVGREVKAMGRGI